MMTKHHKIPKKRMRQKNIKNNILLMPHSLHRAWHIIFGTLTPKEAKVLIDQLFNQERKTINFRKLHHLRDEIEGSL